MIPADIASLERAVVASVAPERVVELPGWLVPLDPGVIGRAKSAVPLTHAADLDAIDRVEEAYEGAGLPPAFRIAETEGLQPVQAALIARGYAPATPTMMKLGTAAGLAALADDPDVAFLEQPDAAWLACFAGDGFDPAEAGARVRNLARSRGAAFAAVREGPRTTAVGVLTVGLGWAGVHGMRTAPDRRGRGQAGAILAAMGRTAQAQGAHRAFLQVTEENPARRLYRGAGFTPAWRYAYWSRG